MDKINIYINSKNRDSNEKISNFTVRIPQNLLRLERGEHFSLNVNGFYCYNSWFNCIDEFNNEFQLIIITLLHPAAPLRATKLLTPTP